MPQKVPAAANPVAVQTGVPVPQATAAVVTQTFGGAQLPPSTQPPQVPVAEHTSPVPQAVPAGWSARSVHTAAPLEHS